MHVALAAFASGEIEFEVGVCRRGSADVVERGGCERGASQVRVKNDAGGVDDRTQRVAERLPKLAFDGIGKTRKGEGERLFIQTVAGNLLAQALKNHADAFRYGGVAFASGERLDLRLAQNFVRGRELAEQRGIDVPEVLGSRSTHLAAGFGGWKGRKIEAGDEKQLVKALAAMPAAEIAARLNELRGAIGR